MSNYDASIRISTKIDIKSAEVQLATLENKIVKTSDKIASLRAEMDALKDAKVPTQEYKTLAAELEKLVKKQNAYNEELKEFEGVRDKESLPYYKELQSKLEDSYDSADRLISKMQELSESGKAFTLGQDTEEFAKLGQQLRYAENDLSAYYKQREVLELKREKAAADGYKRLGDTAKKAFASTGKVLKKVNSYVDSFGNRLKNIAQKVLPTFHKEAKRTNTVLGQFSTRLKSLLSGIFIFNAISAGFRKLFSGVGESFQNFYKYSGSFKKSVDGMQSSLAQLKNSIAAAFAPIATVAIPYLEKFITYITKAVNSIGQLIAALLGKKTYTKAVRTSISGLEDTSDAFDDVEESAKDAEKAIEGYLNPLDEVYKFDEGKEVKVDIDTGKKPDIPDIGDTIGDMFEEVPIDSYFLDLADKIKDIFSQFFAPLKEAWDREGKFVMDSWKYALGEIWDLIKSIGSDFLEVWQQPETIAILADILHIVGDIGLVVGNLAHNFRLAWEENETGKHILEGVRDIIGVIVDNIRHAADATVEWSKDLDFSPLLTKIQLLPLGKWTIEKGLPELLQVFIDFNNKVDWEALRTRLEQFWEHLEPFAETVGEGLIIFIERCADALADFINSPAFDKFLTMIENWMDNVRPEDVADALENIAESIIVLKGALAGFSVVSKGLSALSKLVDILKFFGAGSGTGVAGVLKTIGKTIGEWAPHIAVGAGIATVLGKIKETMESKFDTSNWDALDWISNTLETSLNGWKSEFEGLKISLELWWQDNWMSDVIWNFGQWWDEKVAPWFTQEKWAELGGRIKEAFSTKWDEFTTWWNNSTLVIWWNESVKPWFTKEKWLELYDSIKQALIEKWNNIVEWWSGSAVVSWWNEHVKPWFTKEQWMELFNNIKESLKEVWDNTAGQWGRDISAWWENHVAPWFTKEKWSEVFNNIKESLKKKWSDTVGQWSKDVSQWWDKDVKPWFTKEKWESILKDIPSAFSSKFSKVVETVKEKIQPLIDWVIEKVEWMIEKINSVKEKFDDIKGHSGSIFGGGLFGGGLFGGGSFNFSTKSYSLSSPAIASLSNIPIPGYATGQVIPRTMSQHLAILGDNNRETEVVSPLSTMKQAFKEAMAESGGIGRSDRPIILKVILEGKQILYAVVKEGKIEQMATGNNIFLLEG